MPLKNYWKNFRKKNLIESRRHVQKNLWKNAKKYTGKIAMNTTRNSKRYLWRKSRNNVGGVLKEVPVEEFLEKFFHFDSSEGFSKNYVKISPEIRPKYALLISPRNSSEIYTRCSAEIFARVARKVAVSEVHTRVQLNSLLLVLWWFCFKINIKIHSENSEEFFLCLQKYYRCFI